MTTDPYRQVLYSDGEEVTPDDLINSQSTMFSRVMDQLMSELAPNISPVATTLNSIATTVSTDPEFAGQLGTDPVQSPYAYCVTPGRAYLTYGSARNKIAIAPGTLMQKIAASDGSTASMIPFKFDGTTEFTLSNGDATNPRVDLLQMQLSYIDTDNVTRLIKTNPVKSTLDFSTLTADVTTVVRAKATGIGGNNVSVSLQKRSSGTGVTYSESGNAITIIYQNGVSTVASLEAAIVASSTLLDIQSTGVAGNVLTDPADSFVATHLTGGVDALIVNILVNTTRRVQCVLSVKQGTPAASPTHPDPDTGCVVVGSALVTAGWTTTAGHFALFGLIDYTPVTNRVIVFDQRMPICVRSYVVSAANFILKTAWTYSAATGNATTTNATNDVSIPCPTKIGRLIAISWDGFLTEATTVKTLGEFGFGGFIEKMCTVPRQSDFQVNEELDLRVMFFSFENHHNPFVGPIIQQSAAKKIGTPVWTNGRTASRPKQQFFGLIKDVSAGADGEGTSAVSNEQLCLRIQSGTLGDQLTNVTFYVAEGL